ncbi:hypothetical protein AYM40_35075 [Paraburkholderia phytofirmans OLGA172]|uniref:Uncharacterized protein n=1 Tax=Paraburkholderia phytofirmans OLGA172 TaxID=1417228 RepID=A0A160FVD7_9BURK|nr:hypothetical protein [Paraburkholderia phytofirmans]ANB77309.1 hypothetical protein AYM40_35075 [Paraburkholderia phytofirmans OLGA172]
MALELARALAATERDDDFHIGRLLLLLEAHSGEGQRNKPMEGLTKLAKLDFLLRYPNCLERALTASQRSAEEAHVREFERTTIESKMIRFRYGPWDHRYRRWVSLMAARSLVEVGVIGKTVQIWLTPLGHEIAEQLTADGSLEAVADRASVVAKRFGTKSGTALKDFVYDTFPEITDMKWGQEIKI